MHPTPEKASGTGWWDASQARFHLCLQRGAGKHFSWLEVGRVKMAFSLVPPTSPHQGATRRVSRKDHTGRAANR